MNHLNRRHLLQIAGTASAAFIAPAALHAVPDGRSHDVSRLYQNIHRRRITTLGVRSHEPAALALGMHQQFAQVIEQNIAQMDQTALLAWLATCDRLTLDALASRYQAAIVDTGRPHVLSDLLVLMLDTAQLSRLAPHFGTDVLAASLARWWPGREAQFLAVAGHFPAPAYLGPTGASGAVGALTGRASGINAGDPLLDYTLREIYLSYRTAPFGALSVRAALYQTVHHAGRHLTFAYAVGHLIGSGLAPLIQEHAPALSHMIGHTMHQAVTIYQNWTAPRDVGAVQHIGLPVFQMTPTAHYGITTTGGDFRVVHELPQFIGGGGHICWDCSINRG